MRVIFEKLIIFLKFSEAVLETTLSTSTFGTVTDAYEPCEKEELFTLQCTETEFVISTDIDCEYFLFSRRYSNVQINAVSGDSSVVDLSSCPHLYYSDDQALHIPFGECESFVLIKSEATNRISYYWNLQLVKRNFYINEIGEQEDLDQEETFLYEFKCGFENGIFLNTSATLNDHAVVISSDDSTAESPNFFSLNLCALESSGACSSSELHSIKLGQLLRLKLDSLFQTLDYRIQSLTISSGISESFLVLNGCVVQEFNSFVTIDKFAKEIHFESFAFANSQNIIFEVAFKACSSEDPDFCYVETDCDNGTGNDEIFQAARNYVLLEKTEMISGSLLFSKFEPDNEELKQIDGAYFIFSNNSDFHSLNWLFLLVSLFVF